MMVWFSPFLLSLVVGVIVVIVLSFSPVRKYSAFLEETRENVLTLLAPFLLTVLPVSFTQQPPAPPHRLKAVAASPTEGRLSWRSGSAKLGPLHTEKYRVETRILFSPGVEEEDTVPAANANWCLLADDLTVCPDGAGDATASIAVDDLEPGGSTEYRVFAFNSAGETCCTTPAKLHTKLLPNAHDGGDHSGLAGKHYTWGQTKDKVTAQVHLLGEVDKPTKGGKSVKVELKVNGLTVKVNDVVRLQGALPFAAVPDDLTWTLEGDDGTSGGGFDKNAARCIELEFAKRDKGVKWPTLLCGDPEIDVREVVFSNKFLGRKSARELVRLGLE